QLFLANSSANSNSWGGTTTISRGSVVLLANEQIPHGPGAGDVVNNATLDLRGHTETINALVGSGTVTNDGVSTGTLILGAGDHSGVFSGTLANGLFTNGVVTLTKIGSGIQTLAGFAGHTGATTINGGILSITGSFN